MSSKWKYFLPGYIWALPVTIVGVLIALVWYRCHSWRISDGCIECVVSRGAPRKVWWAGQCWGNLVMYGLESDRQHSSIRIHERVHTVQVFIGGVFMPLAYAAMYLYDRIRLPNWRSAYRSNPFEAMAYDRDEPAPGKWGYLEAPTE